MSNPYNPVDGGPPAPISMLRTISDSDVRSPSARSTSLKSPGNDIEEEEEEEEEEGTGKSSTGANEDTLSDLKISSKSAQEGTCTNTNTN
ncbi:MAG: hypothetical protein ACI90V_009414 [Bacillariaceae sp.]|jgi:hypothetical protein